MYINNIEEEYDSDDDDPFIDDDDTGIDEYYEEDILHIEANKENYKYYIGISKLVKPEFCYILLNSVSVKMFFAHSYGSLMNYLVEYSLIHIYRPTMDILKLYIAEDETYTVIKKTVWIRLIQRHWKAVFNTRRQIVVKRRGISIQRIFETTGKYPSGFNSFPTLYGMLAQYSKNNK
jgi:hypothetical protein